MTGSLPDGGFFLPVTRVLVRYKALLDQTVALGQFDQVHKGAGIELE